MDHAVALELATEALRVSADEWNQHALGDLEREAVRQLTERPEWHDIASGGLAPGDRELLVELCGGGVTVGMRVDFHWRTHDGKPGARIVAWCDCLPPALGLMK